MKKLIIMSLVAVFAAACGPSAESACENVNDVCADQEGFSEVDCSATQEAYDELEGDEKEAADKMIECMDDAGECADVIACAE